MRHPFWVHFPIAFTVLAVFWQGLALLFKKAYFTLTALITLALAALAAIIAASTGTGDEVLAKEIPGIHEALELHETLGNLSAWLLGGGGFLLIFFHLRKKLPSWLLLVGAVILASLLVVTGHYGGNLVFNYGAGVTAESGIP